MTDDDNGILAQVPAQWISEGARQLPRPGPDQEGRPQRRVLVAGVRDLGTVRITYLLRTYRHRRARLWHWVPVHAEPAPGADPGPDLH